MPLIPIVMPQLGESIAEAKVVRLIVAPGETVRVDQEIVEVETNKATSTVSAPCSGRVDLYTVQVEESYAVGTVLGYVEATEEEARRQGLVSGETLAAREGAQSSVAESAPAAPFPADRRVEPTVRGLPVPAHASGASYMSPRLKARMQELGLHAADLAGVAGTGAAGRVTIEDFERFIETLDQSKRTPASGMRIAVADAMRRSWTRPLATVAMPVRLDAVLRHRRSVTPSPGPALYALRALALALAENSAPAGRLVGNQIVHPVSIDVGFAVEAEDGVVVPVIRRADERGLMQMVERYNELVGLARQRRLPSDACGGSIATVTNFGTFGLTWATPIPLPEQTLVLGMGAGRLIPAWDEAQGRFLPVMEANMTLSFDHRVLDGGAAGRLLTRVTGWMNTPEDL